MFFKMFFLIPFIPFINLKSTLNTKQYKQYKHNKQYTNTKQQTTQQITALDFILFYDDGFLFPLGEGFAFC